MTTFTAGWLMGLLTGGLAGVMGLLTYQWMAERARWRARTELDPYVERLRALDRATDDPGRLRTTTWKVP